VIAPDDGGSRERTVEGRAGRVGVPNVTTAAVAGGPVISSGRSLNRRCHWPNTCLPYAAAIYTYNVLGINSQGGPNATFSQLGVLLTGGRVGDNLSF